MTTTPSTAENVSHSYRPKYIPLGTDRDGATHLYRTSDETVYSFTQRGAIEYRFDVDGIPVDDYVAHVTDARGWQDCRYGFDVLLDQLADTCRE